MSKGNRAGCILRNCVFLVIFAVLAGARPAVATKAVPLNCDVSTIQMSFVKSPSPEIMPPVLNIQGTLETPTPGYRYELLPAVKRSAGIYAYVLKLIPPAGENPTVIDKVEIDERLTVGNDITEVEIKLEKPFQWGPDRVKCQRVKSPRS
jgi:hypothetical protein